MTTAAQEIARKALELSEDDRHYVVDELNNSFSREVNPQIEEAWKKEIERRVKEVDEGKVELIPLEEVLQRVREKLEDSYGDKDPATGGRGPKPV